MAGRDGDSGQADSIRQLPPLILHPFADRSFSEKLQEDSRTLLMAYGLLGGNEKLPGELSRMLLGGRFAEIRMLFFLGKDLNRWLDQCVESTLRIPELARAGLCEQSFARLLTDRMPVAVARKLQDWGVRDTALLFGRAIGLNQLFAQVPESTQLAEGFIRHYHLYADRLFQTWMQTAAAPLSGENFQFDLYASGEYAKMLEEQWGRANEP